MLEAPLTWVSADNENLDGRGFRRIRIGSELFASQDYSIGFDSYWSEKLFVRCWSRRRCPSGKWFRALGIQISRVRTSLVLAFYLLNIVFPIGNVNTFQPTGSSSSLTRAGRYYAHCDVTPMFSAAFNPLLLTLDECNSCCIFLISSARTVPLLLLLWARFQL